MYVPRVVVALGLIGPASLVAAAGLPEIQTFGTLRAVVHEGDLGEKVKLSAVVARPHAYAVGALTGLHGEITVLDGRIWLARPGRPSASRSPTPEPGATLMVATHVARWRSHRLPAPVAAGDIDAAVERIAGEAGVPADQPFPFLIEGGLVDLHWHVIDGSKMSAGGGTASSHAQHLEMAERFSARRARGTLVGFFSKRHHGVFTHMGSNTHMHVVLPDRRASGHVDRVALPAGTVVKLPEVVQAGGPGPVDTR
jgi:Alpha-acetolactate decarboxylase